MPPLPAPLARLMGGPPLRAPVPLDLLAERWWRLQPRVRLVLVAVLLAAVAGWSEHRVGAAEARWGGPPQPALVATTDLPVGTVVGAGLDLGGSRLLRRVRFPPTALPPAAVTAVPLDGVLALALPRGAVLTRTHLDPRGPAAGLEPSLRAVPVPIDRGWGLVAGGWVDVWVLGAGDAPAAMVAASRPVLEVDDGAGTALVGLHTDEVGPATEGLALGRILLTHAPP
jgi:hypothetical protein